MNQQRKNRILEIVAEYEILFFLLLIIIGIFLIFLGCYIGVGPNFNKIGSTFFLQLGVGLIIGVIITITVHRFLKIKVSLFKFADR